MGVGSSEGKDGCSFQSSIGHESVDFTASRKLLGPSKTIFTFDFNSKGPVNHLPGGNANVCVLPCAFIVRLSNAFCIVSVFTVIPSPTAPANATFTHDNTGHSKLTFVE